MAINVLYNALDADEFTKVIGCKSPKGTWDKLKELHEGNDNVKERR